ncbi:unnamed protein product [Boreogadus saida]
MIFIVGLHVGLAVLYLQTAEVTRERVYAMHPSSNEGVEDMSCLAELHEAAILHNLHQRYKKDSIYGCRGVDIFTPSEGLHPPPAQRRVKKSAPMIPGVVAHTGAD